jgi:hypothetical protein
MAKIDLDKWLSPKIFKNALIDHLGRFSPRFFKNGKDIIIHSRRCGCNVVFKERRESIDKGRYYTVDLCLTHGVEIFNSGLEVENTTLLKDRI